MTRFFLRVSILPLFSMSILGCSSAVSSLSSSAGSNDGAKDLVACPAIGFVSSFSITYNASSTLPRYLAVAINDAPNGFDACAAATPIAATTISIQTSGNAVQIAVPLDGASNLNSSYFAPNSEAPPIRADVGFRLYGRNSCSDPLVLITTQQGLTLPWQAVTPYGSACGIYGYTAAVIAP